MLTRKHAIEMYICVPLIAFNSGFIYGNFDGCKIRGKNVPADPDCINADDNSE